MGSNGNGVRSHIAYRFSQHSGFRRTILQISSELFCSNNLFDIPISEISETRVLRTIFEGKTVYDTEEEFQNGE